MSGGIPVFETPTPRIRRVAVDRPWSWLSKGWGDLVRAPKVSLAYGTGLVGLSLLLAFALWLFDLFYLLLPLAAGFMLLAPVLAVGFYETSRRLGCGEIPSLAAALVAWRRNPSQIVAFGLLLMFCHLVWVRVATLLYPLFFTGPNPSLPQLSEVLFFSPMSLAFLVTGALIGAVLAALVFAMSVVSVPMLLDREVSVFTAIATSWVAVRNNRKPMALWAALIVFFTALGLATFFVGLAITLPLIGHASWHCYKDVVE